MMQISTWTLLGAALLWLVFFMLQAIRLDRGRLSQFELDRRSKQGDTEAKKMLEREKLLPRLVILRSIIASILLVVAVVVTVAALDWFLGIIVASAFSLCSGVVARSQAGDLLSRRLYDPYEQRFLDSAVRLSWLDWSSRSSTVTYDTTAASKEELLHIAERSAAVLSRDELRRLEASITLDDHAVRDVMTPAAVLETADINDSLGPLVLDGLHKTGHSRFPVTSGDIHHIEGILYLHDIINLKSAKQTVREAMDPKVHYIHEEQSLEHALHGFLRTHRHLFVVVNDYRETVGVVTLEDVLEALLGKKIIDEFDQFEDLRSVAASNPRKNNLPKGKTDI